jgi:Ca-activated chloride channel homolog
MHLFLNWIIMTLLFLTPTSYAMRGEDLWWRKDQQGMRLLKQGKPLQAAQTFESSSWKAVADYRCKQYSQAQQLLKLKKDAISQYNLGNALALQGKYKDAIDAYNAALKQNPNLQDAIYNRELIKKLLKKEKSSANNSQKSSGTSSVEKDSAQKNNPQQESQKQKDREDKEQKTSGEEKQKNAKDKEQKASGREERKNAENGEQIGSAKKEGHVDPGTNKPVPTSSGLKTKGDEKNKEQMTIKEKQLNQETEQWLQQIPDDPGELLRRKIMRDHLRNIHPGPDA